MLRVHYDGWSSKWDMVSLHCYSAMSNDLCFIYTEC